MKEKIMKSPCEECLIKTICSILCKEKILQLENKIIKRKKLDPRGGVLLIDFMAELASEGKVINWLNFGDSEIGVKNAVT